MNKKLIAKISIFLIIIIALVFSIFMIAKENNKKVENTIENLIETTIIEGTESEEETLESEGFEDGPMIFSASEDVEETLYTISNKVYFSQTDSRWKWHSYTSTGNSTQTIGSSGCGPTSAVMVITTITGKTVYPNEMGDLYVANGYRSSNNGTYLNAFAWTAKQYGIPFERTDSLDRAIELLRNNNLVIASCGNGLFTTGGHLIAIMGISGDTLEIYDPYLYNGKFDINGRSGKVTVSGTTVYCSIDNFRNYANAGVFFAYEYTPGTDPITPTPEPTPEPTPVITYSTGTVKVKTSLNVRKGPGTSYAYVKSLYNGNTVTIYEESNGWYRIGDNQWAIDDYIVKNGTVNPEPSSQGTTYTVVRGDNLTKIANKYNTTPAAILAKNKVKYPEMTLNLIRVGWVLTIEEGAENTTVGETKYFKKTWTYCYDNSDLSGTAHYYYAGTKVRILENISGTVDKVYCPKNGKTLYVSTSVYR